MTLLQKVGLVSTGVLASGVALAAGPDVTSLTAAVDFGTVIAGLMTVAGALIGVYIVIKAATFIFDMIKKRG